MELYNNYSIDVVVGLQHGDEGKGKVIQSLYDYKNYDIGIRFNGGGNAGHTFYRNDEKVVLHQLPISVTYPHIKSYIGPQCVIEPTFFIRECEIIRDKFKHDIEIYIHPNTTSISSKNLEDDAKLDKIGSTKKGIGYAYADRAKRTAKLLKDVLNLDELPEGITVTFSTFNNLLSQLLQKKTHINCLGEGAQGFKLDSYLGNYPYVTSSNTLASAINTCGVSLKNIRHIYGAAKPYETYVGAKDFGDKDDIEILTKIQKYGDEFGATTGRPRKVNWLNLDELNEAVLVNNVNFIIFSKMDILNKVLKEDPIYIYLKGKKIKIYQMANLHNFINNYFKKHNIVIIYTHNPKEISF